MAADLRDVALAPSIQHLRAGLHAVFSPIFPIEMPHLLPYGEGNELLVVPPPFIARSKRFVGLILQAKKHIASFKPSPYDTLHLQFVPTLSN